MAPRRKSIRDPRQVIEDSSLDKENVYLRRLNDYQSRVRRRETVRSVKHEMEHDLKQRIELEAKIREGSAKLLAAAQHRAQTLEAARAFITSNKRTLAYTTELQRREKDPTEGHTSGSTAQVSLSDLRFPLMWRDSDHFKNRGDHRRFAVFCLARVNAEIHDTILLCPIDRNHTDITFVDPLIFNNVSAAFELILEVYSCILKEDFSIASTPCKIRKSIHSSISKTLGKKLATFVNDEISNSESGPHFELIASARLTIENSDDDVRTHDLVINNTGDKHSALPLYGHFCCRLAAFPQCVSVEVYAGEININGRKYWARLRSFFVKTWHSRKLANEEHNQPVHVIPINQDTSIELSSSSTKELLISNFIDGVISVVIFKTKSSEEAHQWLKHLRIHAKDHGTWKRTAKKTQHISPKQCMTDDLSHYSNEKQSLYKTSLIDTNTFAE